MRLRPGIVLSTLLTLILALGIIYLSIQVLKGVPLLSSLGVITSVSLILVSALVFKGNERAILLLSVFYMVLGVMGLFLIPFLPSEGMLTFIFSVAVGSYLLKYRNNPLKSEDLAEVGGEGFSEEPQENESEGVSKTPENGLPSREEQVIDTPLEDSP